MKYSLKNLMETFLQLTDYDADKFNGVEKCDNPTAERFLKIKTSSSINDRILIWFYERSINVGSALPYVIPGEDTQFTMLSLTCTNRDMLIMSTVFLREMQFKQVEIASFLGIAQSTVCRYVNMFADYMKHNPDLWGRRYQKFKQRTLRRMRNI